MIIKELILQNFRQFRGEQTIAFSKDEVKKATIVIAKNTTGKTTLLEAFSWAFYGKCKLKSVINTALVNELQPGEISPISVSVLLTHRGRDYKIIRTAEVRKNLTKATIDNSILTVEYKDEAGITNKYEDTDAVSFVNEVVPENLFQYFFFQGENIEKFGSDISSNNGVKKNAQFVSAVQGMLGFNWLYTEQADLKKLATIYRNEIANNNNDKELQKIQTQINDALYDIERFEEEKSSIEDSIRQYEKEQRELNEEILKSGDVANKQQQSLALTDEINQLQSKINTNRRELFRKFSSRGFQALSMQMATDTVDALKETKDIDKGIPGLNASAIKYLLDKKECICGQKLTLGDEHYTKLYELMKFLPPNNIGGEIKNFNAVAGVYCKNGSEYLEDFRTSKDALLQQEIELAEKKQTLETINNDIKAFPDMTKKKEREKEVNDKIDELNIEKGGLVSKIEDLNNTIKGLKKEKDEYQVTDRQTKMLEECEWQVNKLIERISRYCENKEKEKRKELQDAINGIFSSVFNTGIELELTDSYGINIKNNGDEDDAFGSSTSQDAIMAFAFIGGIIKLARENAAGNVTQSNISEVTNDLVVEPYPLVMDAPSSSFDLDRIASFCKIMPAIAEQVIFFIKDTDGLYVKENLKDVLGKEYVLDKENNYYSIIREVK